MFFFLTLFRDKILNITFENELYVYSYFILVNYIIIRPLLLPMLYKYYSLLVIQ